MGARFFKETNLYLYRHNDVELVNVVKKAIPGITISHHYGNNIAQRYHINCQVDDDSALRRLVDFAALANCWVTIYHDGDSYRYCINVPGDMRDFIVRDFKEKQEEAYKR